MTPRSLWEHCMRWIDGVPLARWIVGTMSAGVFFALWVAWLVLPTE